MESSRNLVIILALLCNVAVLALDRFEVKKTFSRADIRILCLTAPGLAIAMLLENVSEIYFVQLIGALILGSSVGCLLMIAAAHIIQKAREVQTQRSSERYRL
jgi:hypothetical protein